MLKYWPFKLFSKISKSSVGGGGRGSPKGAPRSSSGLYGYNRHLGKAKWGWFSWMIVPGCRLPNRCSCFSPSVFKPSGGSKGGAPGVPPYGPKFS